MLQAAQPASNHPLDEAYAFCLGMARRHYENFPVASWLVPTRMRSHVAAVYAFARYADDLADEGCATAAAREQALDAWMARLRRAVAGNHDADATEHGEHLICRAVAASMTTCDLPLPLFEDLVSAFRQDVRVHRYRDWEHLLDYCRRSANPVGRLVLRIAGYRADSLDRASDEICSALQLTNFLQDVDIDWQKGRIYVPADLRAATGATEAGLTASEFPVAWQTAVAEMATRTRAMFARGRRLCDAVGGRLGLELRLTWLGGCRILDRLQVNGYDPRARRPKLGWSDVWPLAWQLATWRQRS